MRSGKEIYCHLNLWALLGLSILNIGFPTQWLSSKHCPFKVFEIKKCLFFFLEMMYLFKSISFECFLNAATCLCRNITEKY